MNPFDLSPQQLEALRFGVVLAAILLIVGTVIVITSRQNED